jgi:hypothetical protein
MEIICSVNGLGPSGPKPYILRTYDQLFVLFLYTWTVALSLYTYIVEPGASLVSAVSNPIFCKDKQT